MKTIIIGSIFTLFFTSNSFAQPIKGTSVLGGSTSFSFSKLPNGIYESQRSSFSISPSFGKFISEKYLLEGGLNYAFQNKNNQFNFDSFSRQTSHSFSIKLGATRFFPITDQLYFTLGATIIPTYIIRRIETEWAGVQETSYSNMISGRLNMAPGLTYFINKKWMLYSFIGVLNYELTYDTDSKQTGHDFYANVSANSFGLGARYIIGTKTKSN